MSLPQPPMSSPPPPPSGPAACYRHPQREAGRRCTRCGRPACSDCLVQASVGSHCLDCAKADRPNLRERARFAQARQPTLVTYVMMAISIGVYVWVLAGGEDRVGRGITLREYDLGLWLPAIAHRDEWYRIITSGFLHFGIIHIGMNMLLLWQLGSMLEPQLGRIRFALVYLASLVGGAAMSLAAQPDSFSGGASGAVFGLIGFAAVGMYRRGVNPFSTGIGSLLILNLVISFTLPNISWSGHLGGLIAGGLCAVGMITPAHVRPPAWTRTVVPIAVLALAAFACYLAVAVNKTAIG